MINFCQTGKYFRGDMGANIFGSPHFGGRRSYFSLVSGYKFKKISSSIFYGQELQFLTQLQKAKLYDEETKTIPINFDEKI